MRWRLHINLSFPRKRESMFSSAKARSVQIQFDCFPAAAVGLDHAKWIPAFAGMTAWWGVGRWEVTRAEKIAADPQETALENSSHHLRAQRIRHARRTSARFVSPTSRFC